MIERLNPTLTVVIERTKAISQHLAYYSALSAALFVAGENKNAVAEEIPVPPFPGESYSEKDVPHTQPEPEIDAVEGGYETALDALRDSDIEAAYARYKTMLDQLETALQQKLNTTQFAEACLLRGRIYGELGVHLELEDFSATTLEVVHKLKLCEGDATCASKVLFGKYEADLTFAFARIVDAIDATEHSIRDAELHLEHKRRFNAGLSPAQQAENEKGIHEEILSMRQSIFNAEAHSANILLERATVSEKRKPLEEQTPAELQALEDTYTYVQLKSLGIASLMYGSHFGRGRIYLVQERFTEASESFLAAADVDYFSLESFEGFFASVKQLTPEEREPFLEKAFVRLQKDGAETMNYYHTQDLPLEKAQEDIDTALQQVQTLVTLIETHQPSLRILGAMAAENIRSIKRNMVKTQPSPPPPPEPPRTTLEPVAVDREMQ